MQKSTIWITGSAGRLGTVLVRLLKAYTDIKVIATDTDLDVTDSEVVKQYASLCRPNVIINCASLSDSAYCEEHMLEAFRVNTIGARNLATAARKANAKIIQLSTDDVFSGKTSPVLTEFDVPDPDSVYGRSKLKAERMLAEVPGLNYVVLRPTGVYGPREKDYFLMAKSIKQHVDFAVGFKPQILTFIYVRDLVEAAFLALNRGKRGAIYHLSDGRNYTSRSFSDLLQLELGVKRVVHIVAPLWVLRIVSFAADKIARAAKKTSTLNPDKCRIMKQRNWQCDITAARKELNYHPQWPLTRGVKEAVEWYKKEHWL